MGSKTPLVLTALIAVAGCETTQPAPPPLPTEAELNCPAVDGYTRERLEASSTYIDNPVEGFVPELLVEAPLLEEALVAENRLRVHMPRTRKSITYWRDEDTGLWNMAGVNAFAIDYAQPLPPPPPPPPPPPEEDVEAYAQYLEYLASIAAEEERRRNLPPLPPFRTLNEAASTRLDRLFFDPCVAAGPEHLPGYFDPYVCPPDGSSWVGEIVLRGSEPRLVAAACSNDFALSRLLSQSTWLQPEDLIPLGPEYY